MRIAPFPLILLFSLILIQTPPLRADIVAVAAGIAPCVEEVMQAFIEGGNEPLEIVRGPSAALARQMAAGAPYDLLLEAEPRWPEWLKEKGGITETVVFAKGHLALWHNKETPPELNIIGSSLIAVPEPKTTAYGMLAKEYLTEKGFWQKALKNGSLIFTGSAPQAVMVVKHGPAAAAFVPQSTALKAKGSYILIHGAVIDQVGGLSPEAGETAKAFWNFCRSPEAESIWIKWGFEPEVTN